MAYGIGYESQNTAGGQNPAAVDLSLSCIADFRPSASLFGAIITQGPQAQQLVYCKYSWPK